MINISSDPLLNTSGAEVESPTLFVCLGSYYTLRDVLVLSLQLCRSAAAGLIGTGSSHATD